MGEKWTSKNIPDLSGKIIIVTGANSGLGFENTKQFTEKGAKVIMACRNKERAEKALEIIESAVPNADAEIMLLDLEDLESIVKFAGNFKNKYDQLNVLLNNAGIMMNPYRKTKEGFESQIGINHLGHFALTAHLFDILKKTHKSRVVNVSSTGHTFGGSINFEDFMLEKKYSRIRAYGRSKLANLLFTYELDRRLKKKNIDIISVASNPGASNTPLINPIFGPFGPILRPIILSILVQSAAKGALASSRAATDPNVKSGEYYGSVGIFGNQLIGYPKLTHSNGRSHNVEDAKKLWEISEKLTKVKFEI